MGDSLDQGDADDDTLDEWHHDPGSDDWIRVHHDVRSVDYSVHDIPESARPMNLGIIRTTRCREEGLGHTFPSLVLRDTDDPSSERRGHCTLPGVILWIGSTRFSPSSATLGRRGSRYRLDNAATTFHDVVVSDPDARFTPVSEQPKNVEADTKGADQPHPTKTGKVQKRADAFAARCNAKQLARYLMEDTGHPTYSRNLFKDVVY